MLGMPLYSKVSLALVHMGVTWDDLGFSVLLPRQEWRHLGVCQFLQLFSGCRSAV